MNVTASRILRLAGGLALVGGGMSVDAGVARAAGTLSFDVSGVATAAIPGLTSTAEECDISSPCECADTNAHRPLNANGKCWGIEQ